MVKISGLLLGASAQHCCKIGHNAFARGNSAGFRGRRFLMMSTITTASITQWLKGRSLVRSYEKQKTLAFKALKFHKDGNQTSTVNMEKEKMSVLSVNGKLPPPSVRKTSGACHRTTLVVVKVEVRNTGTNAKSTRRAFSSSSIKMLH